MMAAAVVSRRRCREEEYHRCGKWVIDGRALQFLYTHSTLEFLMEDTFRLTLALSPMLRVFVLDAAKGERSHHRLCRRASRHPRPVRKTVTCEPMMNEWKEPESLSNIRMLMTTMNAATIFSFY